MPTPRHPQDDVLAFLADPASYPDRPAEVERIDTHSAYVFLAGARAYKVKRAVRYPFLDFSTLARRREACDAEVRLNRRTAPALYLGVVPITRHGNGPLALDGPGPVVEWAVVMRRFPQDLLLDRLAAAGGLTSALARDLADVVARFHAGAGCRRDRGGLRAMRDVEVGNARALAAGAPVLDIHAVHALAHACRRALHRHGPLLETRRAQGFVRQCHGDLHLRNIVLLDGVPTLFDAIEFNDDFACIDVWYDVAFLLMDLLARGLRAQASAAFNEYLTVAGDGGGLPLLPLFLATRAAIRAKTSLASAALETTPDGRAAFDARAREYLALAVRLLTPVPPRLVAIGGLSGTGKSSVSAALAPELGAPPGAVVVRSDVIRKAQARAAVTERLPPAAYVPAITAAVYRALDAQARTALAAGCSVVADATFLDPEHRAAIEAAASAAGVPFTGVWLEAPLEQLASRLRTRTADASDATPEVLASQRARAVGPPPWRTVDAAGTPEQVLAAVRAAIAGGT